MKKEENTGCSVQSLQRLLAEPTLDLSQKYRILFSLKALPGPQAHFAITQGLADPSALFRHEVAYCLGQRGSPEAVKNLLQILENRDEHPMVRHEAGEALGAIGTAECLNHLRDHQDDACLEVAQTCQLAMQRIEFYNSADSNEHTEESRYLCIDPAPALATTTPVDQLRETLTDDSASIFERYRALFALRNKGGKKAIAALGASFSSSSALLKHEVAYVLGQMQDTDAVLFLKRTLTDAKENAMVRHEAAEALGAIGDPECIKLLEQYCTDPEPIVADSCIVALGMLEYELSGNFQYAHVCQA